MELTFTRTQNKVEAWHRHWERPIARSHDRFFTIIKQNQKDQTKVEIKIEKSMQDESAPKKHEKDDGREARVQNVIADRGDR